MKNTKVQLAVMTAIAVSAFFLGRLSKDSAGGPRPTQGGGSRDTRWNSPLIESATTPKFKPTPEDSSTDEESDSITLPRSILALLRSNAFNSLDPVMNNALAMALQLSDDQVRSIESAASDALSRMSDLEADLATIRTDEEGGEFFYVPALGADGERIRAELSASLERTVGSDIKDLLIRGIERSDTFAGFGKDAREISIQEQSAGDKTSYFFEQAFLRDGRRAAGKSQKFSDTSEITQRYGRLFERSQKQD